ncbi:Membrane progestin receptor beta, partial [Biomphalaria glabrata]
FPEWFATKFPDIISNVRNNIQKLTTPFDVHETLHEILNFTGTEKANITKRGVSLLKLIPDERNCD